MNLVEVVWSTNVGICLALAAVQLLVWARSRKAWANLFFSVAAVSAAATAMLELKMMYTQTPEAYVALLHGRYVSVGIILVSLVWFVRLYLRGGRLWLVWTYCAWRGLTQILDLLVDQGVYFREITSLRQVPFMGEIVVVPVGVATPWAHFANASNLLLMAVVLDAAIGAWRQGDRRRAAVVGSTIVGAVALGITLMFFVERNALSVPHPLSLVFLIIVVGVALELSVDLANASQLSRDLQQSQKRMNMAVWAGNLGLWEWDAVRNEIWANQVARDRAGVEGQERIDFARFLQTVHPDDREAVRLGIQRILEHGTEMRIEFRADGAKGGVRWMELLGRVERDAGGKAILVRGVSLDVTDRKRMNDVLKESEEGLREAQRIARLGSWELDPLTGTMTLSDEMFRILEIGRESFGGTYRDFREAVHPDDRAQVDEMLRKSLEVGHRYDATHRLLLPDGRIKHVKEQWEALVGADGRSLVLVGTGQDISVERERLQLRDDLARVNRVMQMSELSTSLAHEINQPLGAILNNASAAKILVSSRPEGNEEVVEILGDIVADANRAGKIVCNLRDLVRKKESLLLPLDVNVLITQAADLFRQTLIARRISLRLDLQPDLPSINGNSVSLQQVLVNLVNNALDAMETCPARSLGIRSRLASPGLVTVSIADSGPGIAPANRDSVFEPFFSTKKDGLGMGLRICRSIVEEEHGGRIWCENNPDPGTGATFHFSVPTCRGESG